MIKERTKAFFSFSKKELNGLLVFCLLLVVIVLLPTLYQWVQPKETFDFQQFKSEIAAFKSQVPINQNDHRRGNRGYDKMQKTAPEYFVFNPNRLPVEDWKKLGLTEGQIKVIKNYEAKGGRFYRKEDLKKVYSISASEYEKLEPFINIPCSVQPANHYPYQEYKRTDRAVRELIVVELNSADSITLESLKGIGPVFASRIIKYRNRLGGFYKTTQLKEVYGIDSLKYEELKEQIEVDPSLITKININKVSFEDLKLHPYLRYNQINAIIQYRRQHGYYNNINDVKKITIINEEIFRKIEPYLNL